MIDGILKILMIGAVVMAVGNYAHAFNKINSGDGSPCNPYQISDIDRLHELADSVNAGKTYSGKYFKVTNNISGMEKVIGKDSSHPFCGNFDGGYRESYTINLNIVADGYNVRGLFGYISSGANIHHVKTSGSVTGTSASGVVSRILGNSTNVTISNCINGAAIIGNGTSCGVGGILGSIEYSYYATNNVTITDCINNADCTSSWSEIGGIVGSTDDEVETLIIKNCTNNGHISSTSASSLVGGIVGTCGTNTPTTSIISGCTNKGEVSGSYYDIGGIAGRIEKNIIIDKCVNLKKIEGTNTSSADVGGIVGRLLNNGVVRNSYNLGQVTTICTANETTRGIGGLVGEARSNCKVVNCYNIGQVSASSATQLCVGGLVGMLAEGSYLLNCYTGDTITETGSNYTGNIVGSYYNSGNVQYCHFREGMISTGEVTRVTRELTPAPKYCYKFSHSTSPMNATCTLNGSTKYYLGTYYNTTSYLTYTSGTYVDDALLNALNAWVDANGSEYTRWIADASPWKNLGMPKFKACTPITINSFDVTPSSGQNTLAWEASEPASSYTIYWECPSTVISPVDRSPYSHTELTAGNTYCYEVMAVGTGDNCAENPRSERVCVTVPTCTPLTVSNFRVIQEGDRFVQVAWDNVTGVSYELHYGSDPSSMWLVSNPDNPFRAERLTNGRTYYFAIKPTGSGDYCVDNPLSDPPVSATPNCP